MKQKLKLIFLILYAQTAFSQITPWINHGAVWNYRGEGGYAQMYCQIAYTGDSLFNGKNCQILMARYNLYTASPPIGLVNTFGTGPHLTYSNGDTVFYFHDNIFSILYNFSSQAGESWNLGVDTNSNFCSKSIALVDSTSTMTINSNSHRVLYVRDSINSSVGIQSKIIEHIGSTKFLLPFENLCNPFPPVVEWIYYSLICFHDDSISYYLVPNNLCESPLTDINETLLDESSIVVFPNPVTNYLNIKFLIEDHYTISIYNLLGEIIYNTKIKDKELAIEGLTLKNGIYLLFIENSNQERFAKKIIIE